MGGFVSPRQLLEIEGIDSERFAGFSDRTFTDTSYITPIELQTATEDLLAHHPYIGRYLARNILRFRDLMGAASCTPEALAKEKILTTEQVQKLSPYLQ